MLARVLACGYCIPERGYFPSNSLRSTDKKYTTVPINNLELDLRNNRAVGLNCLNWCPQVVVVVVAVVAVAVVVEYVHR